MPVSTWGALVLAVATVACTESPVESPEPDATSPKHARNVLAEYTEVWQLSDAMADWTAIVVSLDTTQGGQSSALYLDDGPQICRDHFNDLDLWWDGGHGLMSFHMDPPILFVGYRDGAFTNSRGLVFRRAIYETHTVSYATDPAGNEWRFSGRFNAICRAGQLDIGPIVIGGQIVRSQDPIDKPVLIRSACANGPVYGWAEYDPYDPAYQDDGCDGDDDGAGSDGSGIQYQEGDHTNGETVDWNTGIGNGGESACGENAVVEQVCIEVWNAKDNKWDIFACGYGTTC